MTDLPDREVRARIFEVHLGSRGLDSATLELVRLAEASEGFSGAEIEQAVVIWDSSGRQWREKTDSRAPLHWRRDPNGLWYGIGMNGPVDLPGDEPVSGIGHHEAQAFAAWTARLGGELTGAVLQHEYQWEVAARSGLIEGTGRGWEWCANPFHPYPQFSPFPDAQVSQAFFGEDFFSLRGASLHTQRCLRRASFRNWASPGGRHGFTGTRLVFPPA